MNLKYLLGLVVTIPLLPLMFLQGLWIRKKVPDLPEALEPQGIASEEYNGKIQLLVIGESTMAGVGVATHEEGFAGALAKELAQQLEINIHWKVYAKSGFTAKRVKEEIIPIITETNTDLIVVGLGGNDAFKLSSPNHWKKHIRGLIIALRAKFKDTPIVFANMPPIKEFPAFTSLIKWTIGNLVEILGTELGKLITDYDKVYFSSEKIRLKTWVQRLELDAESNDFFSDGVHPSKLTYQIWAKDLTSFILNGNKLKNDLF